MHDLPQVRTIQKTSKAWKVQLIVAWLLIASGTLVLFLTYIQNQLQLENYEAKIFGLTLNMSNNQIVASLIGVGLLTVGVVYGLLVRFLIWWNHG